MLIKGTYHEKIGSMYSILFRNVGGINFFKKSIINKKVYINVKILYVQ